MGSEVLPHVVSSNDLGPKETAMLNPNGPHSIAHILQSLEKQLDEYVDDIRNHKHNVITAAEITAVRKLLETVVLQKLHSLESALQPINRLPKDIFTLIPLFFFKKDAEGWEPQPRFAMNRPLIVMTHVCRSWRDVLLSTPNLWTQIDFSESTRSQQAEAFLRRSGDSLLAISQFLRAREHVEPFLSATLRNLFRVQRLEINSSLRNLRPLLERFSSSLALAPVLEHLNITNDISITGNDIALPNIFQGRFPKLKRLSLYRLRTDLRNLNPPSLTHFIFTTGMKTSVQNMISLFERCPLLEFIQLCLYYTPEPSATPLRNRILLAVLKELVFDEAACNSGILDRLILPKCTEVMLSGRYLGDPTARIHRSSIDYLPVTRGITKAIAMPNSCILSGPNGYLRLWSTRNDHDDFNAGFFTSFPPIPVPEIRELWVGQAFQSDGMPWKQTTVGIVGAFGVLPKVEDLILVGCDTKLFSAVLRATSVANTDGGILLPALRRLTIHAGPEGLDVPALARCAKARKEHSSPLLEVNIVWEKTATTKSTKETELLRRFVVEVNYRVGVDPYLMFNQCAA